MSSLITPVGPGDHIQGPDAAPVTLIEYGDYECPFCGEAYAIVTKIQKRLGENLRFVFRNFPLTEVHPHSLHAAQAAEASGVQDKFWQMHDLLFENQQALEDDDLLALAQTLGLNTKKWMRDFTSEQVTAKIERDFSGGVRSGVNGTPTFFINGVRHDGSYDYSELLAALQEQLEPQPQYRSPRPARHQNPKERKMTHATAKQ